jgi:CRP/FNR family cyclic AMP-dependent transcriptional regulator
LSGSVDTGVVRGGILQEALISMFYTVALSAGETLLLSQYNMRTLQSVLPWIYISTAVATMVITWSYDKIVQGMTRVKLIIYSDLIFAIIIVVFRQLISIPSTNSFIYFALIVFLDACCIFKIMSFYSYMGDYFASHRARRLYGYIIAGMAIGAILGGFLVSILSNYVRIADILYICAFLLILNMIPVRFISQTVLPKQYKAQAATPNQKPVKLSMVWKSHYIKIIFTIFAIITIVSILADYIMLITASLTLTQQELGKFFGRIYGYVGICQLIIQFFLANWLLQRIGVLKVLLILPSLLILSSIAFIACSNLFFAASINFIFLALAETLDVVTRELLFLPLPARLRIRSQAIANGILASSGKIIGSLALLIFSLVNIHIIYYAGLLLILAVLWIIILRLLAPQYKKHLTNSILCPWVFTVELSHDLSDLQKLFTGNETDTIIKNTLSKTADPQIQTFILSILPKKTFYRMKPFFEELASSNDQNVIKRVLKLYGKYGTTQDNAIIKRFQSDTHTKVKEAAITTFCQLNREAALPLITLNLESPILHIRLVTAAACFKYCGTAGQQLTRDYLASLLKDNRKAAAKLLGKINPESFQDELNILLLDNNTSVQQEAIFACQKHPNPLFIPNLIAALFSNPALQPYVLQALYLMPPSASLLMKELFFDDRLPEEIRCLLLHALGKTGSAIALQIILDTITEQTSPKLLLKASLALQAFPETSPLQIASLPQLIKSQKYLYKKLNTLIRAYGEMGQLPPGRKQLFTDTISFYAYLYFALLGLQYNVKKLAHIANLFSNYPQKISISESLEVLETVLPRELYLTISDLISPPLGEREFIQGTPSAKTIQTLLKMDPWICGLTLFNLEFYDADAKKIGEKLMTSQHKLLEHINTISYIKQIELFSTLPANYLIGIAEIAHDEIFYAGEELFKENESGESLYLICTGRISIQHDGREVAQLGPGECIGELALLDQLPRSATAMILEESRLLRINTQDFEDILINYPEIAKSLLKILARRLRETTLKV